MRAIHLRHAILLVLLLSGCGGDASAPESPANFAGNWVANGSSPGGGTFVFRLALVQSGSAVSGTGTVLDGPHGPVSGTVQGNKWTFQLVPEGQCVGSFSGSATINASGTAINGTMSGSSQCTGTVTGTFIGARE